MSSIYEALKRARAVESSSLAAHSPAGPSRTRPYRLLALAVLAGAAVTAAAIYGLGLAGPEQETARNGAAVHSAGIDPGEILELMHRADRLVQAGDLEGAAVKYREALGRAPGYTDAYLKLGEALYRLGRYDEAASTFSQGLAKRPNDARLLNNMGSVLLAKGDAAQALALFVQARRNSADYVEPLYNMACAYARMNRKDAALSSLGQAVRMQPEVKLWAARDPDLASLRGEKEFEAIVNPKE